MSGSVLQPNTGNTVSLGSTTKPYKEAYFGSTTKYIKVSGDELYPYLLSGSNYLGTSSYPWTDVYIGSKTARIGTQTSSQLGFFGTAPQSRQTLSTSSNNQSYSSATSSNFLYILNNIVGILKKYGLINT